MKRKTLKCVGLTLLLIATAYLLYGVIGSFYTWLKQPLLVSVSDSSRSYGFFVVGCVFAALFLVALTLDFLYWYFLFLRPKKKHNSQAR